MKQFYTVPASRRNYLEETFIHAVFGNDEFDHDQLKMDFDSISDPKEIYFLAERFNFDSDPILAEWIIESPLCPRAAALVLFWQSAPYEYMEYDFGTEIVSSFSGKVDESETAILRLIEKIHKRMNEMSFSREAVEFSPEIWKPSRAYFPDSPRWEVDDRFFDAVEGVVVQ